MKGENFTPEYKYPIKIYRISSLEFANGLEVRKMIFSIILAAVLLLSFLLLGVKSDTNLFDFFLKNWLILLTVIPSLITFVVFNLKYDHKGVLPFIRDRWCFYRTKNNAYEHFIEVASDQLKQTIRFEPFDPNKEREGIERDTGVSHRLSTQKFGI
ncbi:TcpE family conjugal transfer membrane protein [Fictibacillus terranigra]|uniref:TcpE family conjugal transfer membrane protein n=1 Tax=Fictibacillus terranigra TaxID=3058424 RepID=A0ABT8E4R9_9BACL|nr:TcpE family conjugal transfer membrane protein [Fictibacillus sp. CENA-BCM004]MDN4072907.1 TcpE family conjugal transfer membrane protein [Fictibacillus sp. CENA-BCM004]